MGAAADSQALGLAKLTMADSLGGSSRWVDLDRLLVRPGNLVGPGFEPGPEVIPLLFWLTNFSSLWLYLDSFVYDCSDWVDCIGDLLIVCRVEHYS